MEEQILKEGWLEKQGGMIKTWKNRWFILRNKTLFYYKEKNGELMGQIELSSNCKVGPNPKNKKQPSFFIDVPSQRNFIIVAKTLEDHNSWIQIIQAVISGKIHEYLRAQTTEDVIIPVAARIIKRPGVKPGSRRPPARSIQL